MSIKGKKRRMDPVCLTCVHGGVCRRAGEGRCRDYADRERWHELPPCGDTRIWWIAENEINTVACEIGTVACELLPNLHVIEEVVHVEAWGYDAEGRMFAVIDGEISVVGTQYLYLDAASAELALRTGKWRDD